MTDIGTPSAVDVLDALPLAIVLVDADSCITGWNAAAEALYGHRAHDVVGRSVVEVLFDEDDQSAAISVLRAAGEGRPWEGDRRVRRADGILLVSSFRVVPVGGGVAWIATDGMDQGLAEQERAVLLSAEHAARAMAEEALGLVEAIVTSAPVGIAVFDLELRYVRVNDAYAALSGIAAADHVGGALGDVVPLPPEVSADLRRVVTTGRTILGRHIELAPWNGEAQSRHFDVSYFPVRTAPGALIGAGATVVEVTEAKRAEAERAVLLRQAEDAQRRLAILATASTVLTTTMELDEMLARLARVLTPGAGDWCIIQLVGPSGASEHVAVSHRDRGAADDLAMFIRANPIAVTGEGPVAEVLRGGQARLLRPDDIDNGLQRAAVDRGRPDIAAAFSVRSSVIVPIESRGNTHGVLILSTDGQRVLGDDDVDLAVEVAHRAALAVGNARAFQHEHQVAETLQRAMLPSTVPAVPGLDVALRYVAATDGVSVGGDWYDLIAFGDGRVGLIVGDVVGHDIAASTAMGQLRSALRAYATEDHDSPGATLARVDRLFETLEMQYATCILGVIDLVAMTLRWSNAGHPPPLLVRDGRASFLLDGVGVILGVTGGSGAEEASTALCEGDLIVLYTDGLIERRTESLSDGMERLAAAASAVAVDDAEQLCDALLAELLPASAVRDDDVAMLVARVRGDGSATATHRIDLDARPESAAVARGFTAGVLGAAGWHDHVEVATLLVSELVTNAIQHGRPPCILTITFLPGEVELSVEDADPRLPNRREVGDLAEAGRGLLLVDALAHRWGTRPRARGKATWFALRSAPEAG